KLFGAAAVLLSLLGVAGGVLLSPRSSDSPMPATDRTTSGSAALPALNRFADATGESGLGAMVRRRYERLPGWQAAGAARLGMDGDGQLDLHLAGQAEGLAALGRNTGGRFACVDPRPAIPRGMRQRLNLPYPGGQVRHAFDFNEDGRLDLLVSWHNNGGALYHN